MTTRMAGSLPMLLDPTALTRGPVHGLCMRLLYVIAGETSRWMHGPQVSGTAYTRGVYAVPPPPIASLSGDGNLPGALPLAPCPREVTP